jgi:regulator of protease activity HflC (stomatin/prohibitin superfamily)
VRSRDLLERFRLAGTPGAASVAGVPADRVAEVSAELEPVFVALLDVQERAHRVRADAQREADRRRSEAREQARALLSAAQREADAIRADAAAAVRREADAEDAAVLSAAGREVDLIRRQAVDRTPAFVDRVMASVRATFMDPRP